ncbi:MAG: three-Cys-motif partner protein TcmP [bacterium]|nr:three-Cys-motif partner protein TcmP [bacterium]MDE0287932.1 three-Cys-motif partner protein TcmP [bacterium]MDE0439689.1 three-Cys-motif partner protein TcmP [bacterium]
MTDRAWGYWTKGKLDILRRYLAAFTTATKLRTSERIYIDAFAGTPENRDRLTNEPLEGSAAIALSVDDPPFTKLRFFEIRANAPRLEAYLRQNYPGRDLQVFGGDCNELIPMELHRLRNLNWAPTFAFIDPNGMEAKWNTLRALARFKSGRKYKAELFLLFAPPMFSRVLPVDGREVRPIDADMIDQMYGTTEWRRIYVARLRNKIEPFQAREDYLNLMRWRLETDLNYRWTHPIEVRNERGHIIYYMIFATDNEAGDRIMRSVYAQAAEEFPKMREEARRLRARLDNESMGMTSLFGDDDESLWAPVQQGERFYDHSPPSRPWFLGPDLPQGH